MCILIFQYTALNMNYSVAGFQVDCLVNNFVKSLLGAIYAVKIISLALIYRMKEV